MRHPEISLVSLPAGRRRSGIPRHVLGSDYDTGVDYHILVTEPFTLSIPQGGTLRLNAGVAVPFISTSACTRPPACPAGSSPRS
jgi:hypothetical protein